MVGEGGGGEILKAELLLCCLPQKGLLNIELTLVTVLEIFISIQLFHPLCQKFIIHA